MELNDAIAEGLEGYHSKKFQRKNDSRLSLFESDEKHLLIPLPNVKYEVKKYRQLQVQKNSHIYLSEDKHYYKASAYLSSYLKTLITELQHMKLLILSVHAENRLYVPDLLTIFPNQDRSVQHIAKNNHL